MSLSKKNYGKTNRKLGHDAERLYAKLFRGIGYPKCVTSRHGSRLHDDSGIDLVFIPYNVQIKAGKQHGLNPANVLRDMENKIKENFPADHPIQTLPSMIITRKSPGQGNRRDEYHDLVIMSFEDFKKIIIDNAKKVENDSLRKSG